jgi:hypothetical protein
VKEERETMSNSTQGTRETRERFRAALGGSHETYNGAIERLRRVASGIEVDPKATAASAQSTLELLGEETVSAAAMAHIEKRMGAPKAATGIRRVGCSVEFRDMTPEQARAHLAKLEGAEGR